MIKHYNLKSYNFALMVLVLLTTTYGIIMINSANPTFTAKQCLGFAISFVAMLILSFLDYNWILRFYWLIYLVNILILLAVFVLGKESHGAKRWIPLGSSFTIQPSEWSKVLVILFTAKLCSVLQENYNSAKNLVIIAGFSAVPLLLIMKQPDLSTTVLIFLVMFTIIFVAGLSYKVVLSALLIIVPIVLGFMLYISNPNNYVPEMIMKDYQRQRILTFINGDSENDEEASQYASGEYQQEYSVRAIGSGQLYGKGLDNDDPTSLKNANYIAEAQNDFIFAVIGEELGFVGSVGTILLLSSIVFGCIITALRAKNLSGRLICCGAAAYIGFQTFINIGVVTRLLPNTGLPLPFFSYGLSSLTSLYMIIGLVLNVGLQRKVDEGDDVYAKDFKGVELLTEDETNKINGEYRTGDKNL